MARRGELVPFPLGGLCHTSISIVRVEKDQTEAHYSYVYTAKTDCCGRFVELTHKEVVRKVQKGRQAIKDGRPIPVCSRCKHKTEKGAAEVSSDFSTEKTAYWPAPKSALLLDKQQRRWLGR